MGKQNKIDSIWEIPAQIELAAGRLYEKIIRLDLKQLDISEYNQRYWGHKLANLTGNLELYSYLLALSLYNNKVPLSNFVFIDYGGGSGILSLLAKELGIGRVIYNDIYDVSCNDVKILGRATDIYIDDYICGGIDELISYVKKKSLSINAISSYDVIEHIYDIEGYLRKLHFFFNNQAFRVVFGSGANIKNPLKSRKIRKGHLKFEYVEREKKWGHKERDTLRSFLDIRREIVADYEPGLSPEVKEDIARLTRGLMKHDIERCVDEYKEKGSILYRPNHPTNTCAPYTGNWAEHLIETEWLESILRDEGFEVKILSGYWTYSNRIHKRFVKNILNIAIRYLGRSGLILSPYYVVYADYNSGC
ncbi:MAG: methyltransferase domain-containing protein [Planctomycetota bacterium]|jgi:hypothetical protein